MIHLHMCAVVVQHLRRKEKKFAVAKNTSMLRRRPAVQVANLLNFHGLALINNIENLINTFIAILLTMN